jgi:tRNA-Thr(GGU) m(6)t(6)A37 methyltransferase TsaA
MTEPGGPTTGRLPGLVVIGVVRTAYRSRADTPVQSALNTTSVGVVEVVERFAGALDGLGEFDFCWLVTWLGDPASAEPEVGPLRQVPFLLQRQPREIGVLATRGPKRINPLGLSLVRILEVTPLTVHFAGVDMVDGTPVIDIKPFVTRFDRPEGEIQCGWFDTVALLEGSTPTSLGPD